MTWFQWLTTGPRGQPSSERGQRCMRTGWKFWPRRHVGLEYLTSLFTHLLIFRFWRLNVHRRKLDIADRRSAVHTGAGESKAGIWTRHSPIYQQHIGHTLLSCISVQCHFVQQADQPVAGASYSTLLIRYICVISILSSSDVLVLFQFLITGFVLAVFLRRKISL